MPQNNTFDMTKTPVLQHVACQRITPNTPKRKLFFTNATTATAIPGDCQSRAMCKQRIL